MADSPQSALVALLDELRGRLPAAAILQGPAASIAYGSDNSRLVGEPDLVLLPTRHEEVQAAVAACHRHGVPLTARGRGSNTTGACIAAEGGVVLGLERMQRIIEIRPDDRVAVVEPGVLNGELQAALAPHGFFWAADPTSAPYSSVGGNLACNAGGPRTLKYGSARDNLMALRAVDGQGREFRCGAAVTKNSTGFDLTRLIAGSEGTLAIITEATLRLTPLPEARRGMRALYDSVDGAAAAVARVMAQPVVPSALEFMDDRALDLVRARGLELPKRARGLLLLEADGREAALDDACAALGVAARGSGLVDWQVAGSTAELESLWAARKALSPALRSLAPDKINEDVVVPVSRVPALLRRAQQLADEAGIPIVCFGHAGNGNLHVNLMFDRADPAQARAAERCLHTVFDSVLALGGTLSGEHGIGVAKRPFMARALDPVALDLMRAIKRQFDPAGILNPGKLLP
ncbi:FAD-binding oxidoreductase [Pseudomarimonas salicorniae]|uniref:FAD-binding protein n=1 Tax=Pseudomarimonas salicorniae TaxID=2933270 RepID=A0ABT0GKR7_9GAMM|nr:FAD-linked oxidase C-terminal domain-containing protein [Lysobacter sp. CAU 1642]MCK7594615.1 FAD-binding protein [Lysobacter sp. CAU 1642]